MGNDEVCNLSFCLYPVGCYLDTVYVKPAGFKLNLGQMAQQKDIISACCVYNYKTYTTYCWIMSPKGACIKSIKLGQGNSIVSIKSIRHLVSEADVDLSTCNIGAETV